jgi:hypothetical protein
MNFEEPGPYDDDFDRLLPSTAMEVFELMDLRKQQMSPEAFERWRTLMIQRHDRRDERETSEGWEPFTL